MKTNLIEPAKEFTPVTLQITFESQREIDFAVDFIGNVTHTQAAQFANTLENQNNYTITDSRNFITPFFNSIEHLKSK